MKLAICNETFPRTPFEEAVCLIRELGYEGVEIAPFTLAPTITEINEHTLTMLRQVVESYGLSVTGMHWLLAKVPGVHLTSPNPAIREVTRRYLLAVIRACQKLGGRYLVFGSPAQRNVVPGVSYEQAWDWARTSFCAIASYAADYGLTFCLEPLSASETNLFTTAAEAIQMIREVDQLSFRLILDVKAMCTEQRSIPEIIAESAPYLAYFHANDANRREPGAGNVDFVPIFQSLRMAGYDGWVSVEVFEYEPDPRIIARRGIQYLRQALR